MAEMTTVFVSALPFKITERELRALFERYGKVGSVQIFADWENGLTESYAHLSMENAAQAIKELDGLQIDSTYLRVNELIRVKP